jgi:hypothetical protein
VHNVNGELEVRARDQVQVNELGDGFDVGLLEIDFRDLGRL